MVEESAQGEKTQE